MCLGSGKIIFLLKLNIGIKLYLASYSVFAIGKRQIRLAEQQPRIGKITDTYKQEDFRSLKVELNLK